MLIAVAGHYGLIKLYGTVLPYRDSWQLTAIELLGPWVDGELSGRAFLQPLNDHWPVLTRVMSFGLVFLNGQWNNLLEVVMNAVLLVGAIGLFMAGLLRAIPTGWRLLFAAATGLLFALPITWENTLWGIQSLPYFQILLSIVYFRGTLNAREHDRGWILAQGAGLLVLFTQHSAILAQVAILPVLIWRWYRGDGNRPLQLHAAILAVLAVAGFAWGFPSLETTAHYKADSVPVAAAVALHQLAWPTGNPALAFVLWAPWLVLVFRTAGRPSISAGRAFLIVTGLWVGSQAVAIGYGRGLLSLTNVSRYGDFLALGVLVNLAALLCLMPRGQKSRIRVVWLVALAGWLLVPMRGLWYESVHSHAGYNLSIRQAENAANLDRVSAYIQTGDPEVLSLEKGGATLFSYPPPVAALLDKPGFRALLPPESGAPEARPDDGRLGFLTTAALARPELFGLLGAGLLVIGGWRLRAVRLGLDSEDPVAKTTEWGSPHAAVFLGVVAVIFTGLWSTWSHPLDWQKERRLSRVFGAAQAVAGQDGWQFTLESPHDSDPDQMPGSVLAYPPDWRPYAYGTVLDRGLENRGVFVGEPMVLETSRVALLFSGYPCAAGNGLRWELTPPTGGEVVWLPYQGPNPGVEWQGWVEDVSGYRDWTARLFIFDGRDDSEGCRLYSPMIPSQEQGGWVDWRRREHCRL